MCKSAAGTTRTAGKFYRPPVRDVAPSGLDTRSINKPHKALRHPTQFLQAFGTPLAFITLETTSRAFSPGPHHISPNPSPRPIHEGRQLTPAAGLFFSPGCAEGFANLSRYPMLP